MPRSNAGHLHNTRAKMPRQHIKVYVTDEWLEAIEAARGDDTISEYVRDCVATKLSKSKDVATRERAKQLPELRRGRKQKAEA